MSSTKRVERIAGDIQKAITQIIYRQLNVEELQMVTIAAVKVTSDLSLASIYYTVLNNSEDNKEKIDKLLRSSNKTIRMYLSKKLRTRTVPMLKFFYDESLDNVFKVEELLNSVKKK